ncbi:MAG: hypothetical protein SGCHY_004767 [Lobulomycetales sp.]
MSSSEESSEDEANDDWKAGSSAFSGISEIPQAENGVAQIAYAQEYVQAMGILRALMAMEGKDVAALPLPTSQNPTGAAADRAAVWLTAYIINTNPAHYSVWACRRNWLCFPASASPDPNADLDAVRRLLQGEWHFTARLARKHPKSYQIWHHRQWLVSCTRDPSRELSFINKQLARDSKNYHAWSYRQWVVREFPDLYPMDVEDVEDWIKEDPYNNSAWTQRYFQLDYIFKASGAATPAALLEKEVSWLLESVIKPAPRNEAAWNYLKGVIVKKGRGRLCEWPVIRSYCLEYLPTAGQEGKQGQGVSVGSVSPPLVCILDIAMEEGDRDLGLRAIDRLLQTDFTRERYWTFRKQKIQAES